MTTLASHEILAYQVINIALEAGEILTRYFNTEHHIVTKDSLHVSNDFATQADFKSQNHILQALRYIRPHDKFIAEEEDFTLQTTSHSEDHELIWHIDPLDGTVNYSRGFEHYAVSIAAVDAQTGEVVIGIVHAPSIHKTYYSFDGKSYVRDELTGEVSVLELVIHQTGRILSAGLPYTNPQQATLFSVLPEIMTHFGNARDLGSCALNLCFLAEGRFDAVVEVTVKTWDYLGAYAIAKGAGIHVSAIPNLIFGGFTIFAAKNEEDHRVLQKYMEQVAGHDSSDFALGESC